MQLPLDEALPDGRQVLQYGGVWYAVPGSWTPPDDPVEDIEVLTEERVVALIGPQVAVAGSALGAGEDGLARAILDPRRGIA